MDKGCIYCGTGENLEDSDIISNALTNKRIINKFVCKTEHNNKFSDLFESKVIVDFSEITNNLDIKSTNTKSGKFHPFKADLIIMEKEFPVKLHNPNNMNHFFERDNPLVSKDKKTFIGSIESLTGIAKGEPIEIIDNNALNITIRTTLRYEIFKSEEIFRLMAKIAFEWYCLKNTIENKAEEFNEIINFIITGKGSQIVTLVDDAVFYDEVMTKFHFGSHTLLSYINSDGSVCVLISFFGIVSYKVRVLDKQNQEWPINLLFQTVSTIGESVEFSYENFNTLKTDFYNSFEENGTLEGRIKMVPIDENDITLQYKALFLDNYCYISSHLKTTTDVTKSLFNKITPRYIAILDEKLLTEKNLFRFISEFGLETRQEIILNPNVTDMKCIFMFHVLLLVGQSNDSVLNINELNTMIKAKYGSKYGDDLIINFDFVEKIKPSLFEDSSSNDIMVGVAKILNWKK